MDFNESEHPRQGDGKFAAKHRGEALVDLDDDLDFESLDDIATVVDQKPEPSPNPFPEGARLQHFKIVGMDRRIYKAAPDAPSQPGGSCWHCGQAIVNCVLVKHSQTGHVETIGMDCAERVGLDRTRVRRLMRDKYNELRAAQSAAMAAKEARLARQFGEHGTKTRHDDVGCRCYECVAANQHGDHGTLERFESGCYCDACKQHAPHGHIMRFRMDNCTCPDCARVAVAEDGCTTRRMSVLVDADTGEVVDARLVDGRYGPSWAIDRPDGGTEWVSAFPKPRNTILKKGYLEAKTDMLIRESRRSNTPPYVFGPVGKPLIDNWGEPIPGVDPDSPDVVEARERWEAGQKLKPARFGTQADWDKLGDDSNRHVRYEVARTRSTSEGVLRKLANDKDSSVGEAAQRTLDLIGDC